MSEDNKRFSNFSASLHTNRTFYTKLIAVPRKPTCRSKFKRESSCIKI